MTVRKRKEKNKHLNNKEDRKHKTSQIEPRIVAIVESHSITEITVGAGVAAVILIVNGGNDSRGDGGGVRVGNTDRAEARGPRKSGEPIVTWPDYWTMTTLPDY